LAGWSFFNRLEFRVALVFVLVSTVPLAIVGSLAVRLADQAIASIVNNQLDNLADEKQALLERWIGERKADVAVVARTVLGGALEPGQIASYVKRVQDEYGVYGRFVVAGPEGRTLYDSLAGPSADCRSQPWFQRAKAEGKYLSSVTAAGPEGESVFLVAEAVRDAAGNLQGVVCATVKTAAILTRVLKVALGETGESYLVDREGTFLAHKQPERILRENIAQSGSFVNIFGGERSQPVYTDYRGIAVLGASRPVPGTEWYVVVEQDRDEAFADSDRMARNIRIAMVATVLGAIALSWVSASYVTAPIRALSEAAHALSRGDFDAALADDRPRGRGDEIGALEAAFRHMAGQLRQRQDQLQHRIGLTEEELHRIEAKLKQTIEAAARSERLAALGRLAAGVAHEIRTPLTSLKLYLQSIQEEVTLSAEQSEDFEVAMRQARRMEATINHFLDFARPREPSMAELDFAKLVDDALVVVEPRANQQEVRIKRSVAARLPAVQGDARQLGEALVNLLVNALEAMPERGRLAIAVYEDKEEPGARERPWVRIDVSDAGPGIRSADLDRLFEPFFTTKASGSGLGLAIVQGVVEGHGGRVKVHTTPGAGTTFSIFLRAKAVSTAKP
jgi:signal transduction histidine kinase